MRSCRQHIQWQIRQSLAPSTTIRQISMQPPNLKPPNLKPPSLIATKVAFGFSEERRRERSGVRCQRDRPHMALWHSPLSHPNLVPHQFNNFIQQTSSYWPREWPFFCPPFVATMSTKNFSPEISEKGLLITADRGRE